MNKHESKVVVRGGMVSVLTALLFSIGPTSTVEASAVVEEKAAEVISPVGVASMPGARGAAMPAALGAEDPGELTQASAGRGELVLTDYTISIPVRFSGCHTIRLGPGLVVVGPGGHLQLEARSSVIMSDGVSVLTGARLEVHTAGASQQAGVPASRSASTTRPVRPDLSPTQSQ